MSFIIVTNKQNRETYFTISGDELVIGRSEDCDVTLDYPGISRKHARIALKNGRWYVEDLGSHNGMLVNGERTEWKYVNNGDLIHLPHHKIEFYDENKHPEKGWREKRQSESALAGRGGIGGYLTDLSPVCIVAIACAFMAAVHWAFGVVSVVSGIVAASGNLTRHHYSNRLAVIAVCGSVLLGGINLCSNIDVGDIFWAGCSQTQKCKSNMLSIWQGIQQYRATYGGEYPQELEELYPEFVVDRQKLSCPGTDSSEIGSGYRYFCPDNTAEPNDVLLKDAGLQNHKYSGVCVLYVHGEVETICPRDNERRKLELE